MIERDKNDASSEVRPIFCARCATELKPGEGDFFVVRIEAVADPTPPNIAPELSAHDHRREIQRLLDQMHELSAQEALDQVYRHLIIYLCNPCCRDWFEDPCRRDGDS